ncbi:MAG: hypothetical protein IPL61_24120 [Myxococcales bacterium]|nr:hypothetical protein [Myxococcales bacterium]
MAILAGEVIMDAAPSRFDTLVNELKQAKDEIRLKLHLAGLDARTAWEKVEPKVDALERRLTAAGEVAAHELESVFDQVAKALARLRDDVDPPRPPGPVL